MNNSFGSAFSVTTFGESHGAALGVIVDGMPAGIPIDSSFIQQELDRRKPGQSAVSTARKESDCGEILSGVFQGVSTGTPIAVLLRNADQHSKYYSNIAEIFRPGHADFTFFQKYGIQWRKGDNRYKQYTLYLGEDKHNHYFGSANLTVLMWFRRTFGLRNGFPVTKVLAEALSVKDAENFTARYAIAELAKYRNTALKDLQDAIEDVLELDEQPYSQFLCMHFLDTPEADALLCRYAASSNPIILTGLFRAFSEINNYRLTQKRIFYRMVQSRLAPQVAMNAAEALNFSKELIPLFQDYVDRPYSMDDYEIGVRSIFRIRNGNVPVPHQSAASQLRDMLLRSGEVRDSMRIYNVQETQYNREDRMAKQDAERIKPYADAIINNQYKDLGLLTALELSVYTPPAEDGFSKAYIRRVRRTGAQLLTNFDSRAVRTMFRNLITHVRSRQERAIFEEAYSAYAKMLKQADLQFKY